MIIRSDQKKANKKGIASNALLSSITNHVPGPDCVLWKKSSEGVDLCMAPLAAANDTGALEENIPGCIGRLFCALEEKKIAFTSFWIPFLDDSLERAFWDSVRRGDPRRKEEGVLAVLWELWLNQNEVLFRGRMASAEEVLQDVEGLMAILVLW